MANVYRCTVGQEFGGRAAFVKADTVEEAVDRFVNRHCVDDAVLYQRAQESGVHVQYLGELIE